MRRSIEAALAAGVSFGLALIVLAVAAMPHASTWPGAIAAAFIGALGIADLAGCWLTWRDERRRP